MIKRETKRKILTTSSRFINLLLIFLLITLLVAGYKFISPLAGIGLNSSQTKLIIPNGETTNINQLSQKLKEKNLILDSLSTSSESGVIVGQLRNGPKVYFSQYGDVSWQVTSLVLIISRTTVDNKKPVLIDLRSSKPIVKF